MNSLSLLIALHLSQLSLIDPQTTQTESFRLCLEAAQTASSNSDWRVAAERWSTVVARNPHQVAYWEKLAEATYLTGQHPAAYEAYASANALYKMDWRSAYGAACCAGLTDRDDDALRWILRAIDAGMPEPERLFGDGDLAGIHGHPELAHLAPKHDSDVGRPDGWRADIEIIRAEIHRRGISPYERRSKEWFDTELDTVTSDIDSLSDQEIAVRLMQIVHEVGDGHSTLFGREPRIPMQFYWFADKLHLVATTSEFEELLGAQVTAIGDHDIGLIFTRVETVISRDASPQWIKTLSPDRIRAPAILNGLGLIPSPSVVPLQLVDRDGEHHQLEVAAESPPVRQTWKKVPPAWVQLHHHAPGPTPPYLERKDERDETPIWWEDQSDLVYCQINKVRDGDEVNLIDTFAAAVQAAERTPPLVVDLRWNNGGNSKYNSPLIEQIIRSEIHRPGHLFVIIGRQTFSAAQNLCSELERRTHVIFVGEPTGSSPNFTGEGNERKLPHSELTLSISDLRWQESWPTDQRIWIAPTLFAPPNVQDLFDGVDPAIRAIREFLENE